MESRLGKRLRNRREQMDLSITELSQRSGISSSYISRLERGIKDSPSIDIVVQIARVLQVPLEYFVNENMVTITEMIDEIPEREEEIKKSGLDYIDLEDDVVDFLSDLKKKNLPKERRKALFDQVLDFIDLFEAPTDDKEK